MKKQFAIKRLGGTPALAAKAMGYKAVQTIYQWPDELPEATADRVNGVLLRIKSKRRAKEHSAIQEEAV